MKLNGFRLTAFALVGLAALVLVPSVQAQTGQGQMPEEEVVRPHQVSGFIGVQAFALTGEIEDAAGFEVDNQVAYGVRYEYRLTPHWGLEGGYTFSPTSAAGAFADRDVDATYLHGNVNYHILPDARLDPYVTGGAGLSVLDTQGDPTEQFFAGNFGAGVVVQLTSHIAVRSEVRDFIYSVNDLDPQAAATLGVSPSFDEVVNDLQVTGGFAITF